MDETGAMADPRGRRPRMPASRRQRVVAVVVAGFCSLFVVGMSVSLVVRGLHTRSLLQPVPDGVEVTGTVVDVYVHQYKGVVYAPVVAFTDSAGRRHAFRAPTSSNRPTIGAPALVSYNPTKPVEAHDLSDSSGSWEMPFYTGAILLTFVSVEGLAGGAFLIHRRRRRRARM
jgi:hypothetical protein